MEDRTAIETADIDSTREASAPQAQLSPEELFAQGYRDTMRQMTTRYGQQQIYYEVLQAVADESDENALTGTIASLPQMKVNQFTPRFYLDALCESGALERTPLVASSEEGPAEPAHAAGEAVPAAPLGPTRCIWELTDVGRQIIDDFSPTQRLHALFAEDPACQPVYTDVLDYCRNARTRQDVEGMLEQKKALQGLNAFTSFFLDRLEQNGGLTWSDGWKTTAEGEECLRQIENGKA